MYSKPVFLLVDSTTIYGGIYFQFYPLPYLTIPSFLLSWFCVIIVNFQLDAGSPQHLYHDMQRCVVVILMKLSWDNTSIKLVHNIIFIVF